MSTAGTQLLTAEEFSLLPDPEDGSKEELVRGVVETMPPPGHPHGKCQNTIAFLITAHVRSGRRGTVTVESGVITETGPDTVRGPDVSYWSKERMPPGDEPIVYANVPPNLTVEVLSPDDRSMRVNRKVREYLAMGVNMIWIVDPAARTVTVYKQSAEGRVVWEDGTIDGEDVLPGFKCRVADFFE